MGNYFTRESSSSIEDSIKMKKYSLESEDETTITKSLSCSNIYDSIRQSSSSNDIASNNTLKESYHVDFSVVEERVYSLTLGDHPDCTYGPPTTLSWNYEETGKTDISAYESERSF